MARPLAELPDWPRMLDADGAAAYLGVSRGKFLTEVAAGVWPAPVLRGRRRTWDKVALDAAANHMSGIAPDAATDDYWLGKLDRA